MPYRLCLLALATVFAAACNEGSVSTEAVRQELQDRKLFHISDVEMLTGAQTVGERIVRRLDSVLAASPACADSLEGPACRRALSGLIAQLDSQEIQVSLLTRQTWDPPKDDPKVEQVLEAARFTLEQGQPLPANLQRDTKGGFHYLATVRTLDSALSRPAGVYSIRFSSRPAAREASKGKKGMGS